LAKLPSDIETRINKLFTSEKDKLKAKELILSLWSEKLNVGPDQLARSILVISDGDLSKLIEIKMNCVDPRDTIMEAEGRLGNPGHYLTKPFDNE